MCRRSRKLATVSRCRVLWGLETSFSPIVPPPLSRLSARLEVGLRRAPFYRLPQCFNFMYLSSLSTRRRRCHRRCYLCSGLCGVSPHRITLGRDLPPCIRISPERCGMMYHIRVLHNLGNPLLAHARSLCRRLLARGGALPPCLKRQPFCRLPAGYFNHGKP